jgi:hypothetical protein
MPAAIAAPTVIFTIPLIAALAPIAAVMIAHIVATAIIVEQVIAIARIPVAVIPATAEAYVIKAIAAVAIIIAVIGAVRVAVIIAVAIVIIAQTHIVHAAGKADGCRSQCREPQPKPFGKFCHLSPLFFCLCRFWSIRRIRGTFCRDRRIAIFWLNCM